MSAYSGRQRLQRDQGIVHNQQSVVAGKVEKIRYLAARDHSGTGAPPQRCGYKIMSIVTLAADREKQVARRQGAGIDGIPRCQFLGRITLA
jgi:hypothetical protein